MSLSPEAAEAVRELFSGVGDITTKRMFGGLGVYHRGTIFSIVMSDGSVLLKGAGDFVAELEAAGARRWVYTRDDGRSAAMPYWTLPDEALDDPDRASDWAMRALSYL